MKDEDHKDNETKDKKPKDDEAFMSTMLDRFALAHEYESKNREEMYDDIKFSYGGRHQWDEKTYRQRIADGRPALTINRLKTPIRQISNEIRQNKPAIKVSPIDSAGDKDIAKIYNGLIRNIETTSMAQVAYQTAADGAIRCGFGAFEIRTQYIEESFDQEITIDRILNQFSVYFDPNATKITREDANWAFVTEMITKEAFERKWPKAEAYSFQSNDTRYELWYDDQIRIARYYVKEPITRELVQFDDGKVAFLTDEQIEVGLVDGMNIKNQRTVKTHKVMCYVVNGHEVLEKPYEIPGKYIPIVPVLGEETLVDGEYKLSGIVRDAKDPQRMYNYWRTTAVETIALQPKVPYLVTAKMIEGQTQQWAQVNKANLPYLIYKHDELAGRPEREQPPTPPVAMWQESTIAADDIKFTSGIFDQDLGNAGNQVSGKAILASQQKSDLGNYLFKDNLSIAITHGGRILIGMIPIVYDTERVIRVLNPDDTEEMISINTVMAGSDSKVNDLSVGKYDVTVSAGPSYQTRRQEAVATTLEFMAVVPQKADIIADLVAKNLDTPEADTIAKRLRKTIPQELLEGDMDEEEQQEAQQQAEAQKPQIEFENAMKQAQLDSVKQKTELDYAKAQETLASIDQAERQNLIAFLEATGGNTRLK